MRIRFKALCALLFVTNCVYATSGTSNITCQFQSNNFKNGFTTELNGHQISVIGWYHGTHERDLAEFTMADAIKKGAQKKCAQAKQLIDDYLEKYLKQLNEGKRVLRELEQQYSKRKFTVIGLEYTPLQYQNKFIDPQTKQDFATKFYSIFQNLCPKEATRFRDLTLVFPGPEFEFLRQKEGPVRAEPFGDDDLIKKIFDIYSDESKTFTTKLHTLTPIEINAYNKFVESLDKNNGAVSESEIEEILADVKKSGKLKLKKYFLEVRHAMSFNSERNKRFVAKIVSEKRDIVFVVGNYHVPGLRAELEKKCK